MIRILKRGHQVFGLDFDNELENNHVYEIRKIGNDLFTTDLGETCLHKDGNEGSPNLLSSVESIMTSSNGKYLISKEECEELK